MAGAIVKIACLCRLAIFTHNDFGARADPPWYKEWGRRWCTLCAHGGALGLNQKSTAQRALLLYYCWLGMCMQDCEILPPPRAFKTPQGCDLIHMGGLMNELNSAVQFALAQSQPTIAVRRPKDSLGQRSHGRRRRRWCACACVCARVRACVCGGVGGGEPFSFLFAASRASFSLCNSFSTT